MIHLPLVVPRRAARALQPSFSNLHGLGTLLWSRNEHPVLIKKNMPLISGKLGLKTMSPCPYCRSGMTVERTLETVEIRNADALTPVQLHEWCNLSQGRPMRTPTWLLEWWRIYGAEPKALRLVLLYDVREPRQGKPERELVGLAPLYTDQFVGRNVFRLLGDAGDICTDHTSWLAKPGYERLVSERMAQYFTEQKAWHRLHFRAVDQADVIMDQTTKSLASQGYLVRRTPTDSCWAIELPDTWDDYLDMLSKSHRKRCRRLVRTYFDSGLVRVHEATSSTFNETWQIFLKLHAKRWGDARRPAGSFTDRRFSEFHTRVARLLFDQQRLRLCYLTYEDQPVAAEYQFLDNETLYAYQSGMLEDAGSIQPGNLSLIASIRFCLENKLKQMDLLRGNEPYKAHWRAQATGCDDIRVLASGVVGQLEVGLLGAKTMAATWWKGHELHGDG